MNRIFAMLCVLVLAGCSNRAVALKESVDHYVKAIRRGDPDIAMSYVHPDKRTVFVKTMDRLDKDLLISQVEVRSIVPDDKLENAVVTLMMEYFDQDSSALMMSKPKSLWKYDEKKKAWLLDSSTPLTLR